MNSMAFLEFLGFSIGIERTLRNWSRFKAIEQVVRCISNPSQYLQFKADAALDLREDQRVKSAHFANIYIHLNHEIFRSYLVVSLASF